MTNPSIKAILLIFIVLGITAVLSTLSIAQTFGQTGDKTFENLEFLLKMNYPSDWTSIKGDPSFTPGTYDSSKPNVIGMEGTAAVASLCPLSEIRGESTPVLFPIDRCLMSPISVLISAFNLPNNTSLKQFADGEIHHISMGNEEMAKINITWNEKMIDSNSTQLSGLPAYKIVTITDEGGEVVKRAKVYTILNNKGYEIDLNARRNVKLFDYFYPKFQNMLDSFKIIDLG